MAGSGCDYPLIVFNVIFGLILGILFVQYHHRRNGLHCARSVCLGDRLYGGLAVCIFDQEAIQA